MTSISLLVINPNSTASMTDALKPLVISLGYPNTDYTFFTAPSGPPSINDHAQAIESAQHCIPHLLQLLDQHDGFLVACYSDHPLVRMLSTHTRKPVIGIFQASVTTSLHLISRHQTFGIVTTGDIWEGLLTEAVHNFIGVPTDTNIESNRNPFAGVETTGLNATDLHDAPAAEVRQRLKEATKRLLARGSHGDVRAICLGCAGMVGLEEVVREACIETFGYVEGTYELKVIDGVKAGVGILQALVRGQF